MRVNRRTGKLWLVLAVLIAPLPSFLKVPFYRMVFGYRIGRKVRIGLSLLIAGECEIADGARIGHGNLVIHCQRFVMGSEAVIGFGNIIRGGRSVTLGDRCSITRFNEINSIIDADIDSGKTASAEEAGHFVLGEAGIITAQHKVDFTGGVTIGDNAILGGRLSSLWTHNRHLDGPIRIGRNTYMGSGIQMVPRSAIGDFCIVGIGSVVTKAFTSEMMLLGGNPAKEIKPLDEDSKILVTRPTRIDLEPVAGEDAA